jgi:hypothetical protein
MLGLTLPHLVAEKIRCANDREKDAESREKPDQRLVSSSGRQEISISRSGAPLGPRLKMSFPY